GVSTLLFCVGCSMARSGVNVESMSIALSIGSLIASYIWSSLPTSHCENSLSRPKNSNAEICLAPRRRSDFAFGSCVRSKTREIAFDSFACSISGPWEYDENRLGVYAPLRSNADGVELFRVGEIE